MDLFDEKIKTYARREPVSVPEGFDARIEKKLAGLPAGKSKTRAGFKVLLLASAFLVVTAVTAWASPAVQRMAHGLIAYFSPGQESAYSSQKEVFQKYNSTVGAAVQDRGITLKIDNIAVDDGYIHVFYTVQSTSPLTLAGSEDNPTAWRLQWTAPVLYLRADGKDIALPALIEREAYLENTTTLKGMERFPVVQALPANFRLEIWTERIFNVQGNWRVALDIDKSAVQAATLAVTPGIQTVVTGGWDKPSSHEITVERVLISPFGSQLVLKEKSVDGSLLGEETFALRDDRGRFLDIVPSQRWTAPDQQSREVTNSFEFLNGSPGIKSLTLIPLAFKLKKSVQSDGSFSPALSTAPFEQVPFRLEQNAKGAIVVDGIDLNEQGMRITYHSDGILGPPYFFLLDENGREIEELKLAVERSVDRQNGRQIITYTFTNRPSAVKIAQIKRLGTLTYDLKLRTEEQIVIPLSD